jgi:copper homeostasis protein (lipoprotein)
MQNYRGGRMRWAECLLVVILAAAAIGGFAGVPVRALGIDSPGQAEARPGAAPGMLLEDASLDSFLAPARAAVNIFKVGEVAPDPEVPVVGGVHDLPLPASFTGDLPCTDCGQVRVRLNLWPDQVFHLRRTWIGKDMHRDSIGRWSVDPATGALDLRGAGEELSFAILGPDRIRLLPRAGEDTPGEESAARELQAQPEFLPFEPHLPLRGMLTFVGDAARFTECLTGREYPLIDDGDYEALEHAYLAAGAEPDGPIMASFDGGIVQQPGADGEDSRPEVLVERFVGVWPDETCERALGTSSLTNTYWKVLRIGDTEVAASDDRREPNLILREGDPRFTATVGCNQVAGSYLLEEGRLTFQTGASTLMACPAPLDDWEKQLAHVLSETDSWRIDGQSLELLDGAGKPLALLQAVYLY